MVIYAGSLDFSELFMRNKGFQQTILCSEKSPKTIDNPIECYLSNPRKSKCYRTIHGCQRKWHFVSRMGERRRHRGATSNVATSPLSRTAVSPFAQNARRWPHGSTTHASQTSKEVLLAPNERRHQTVDTSMRGLPKTQTAGQGTKSTNAGVSVRYTE